MFDLLHRWDMHMRIK